MLFLAVDFGTSSTLAAFLCGGVLKFVAFGENTYTTPTVIHVPNKQRVGRRTYQIGLEAIKEYQEEGDGRLMFSIKSLLGESNFTSTIVPGFGACSAAELCGLFLNKIKHMAEQQFGHTFEGVVLGRPANFSKEAVADLRKAAHLAEFKKVVFVPEPIAAGIKYFEQSRSASETVFVIDAGGGTTDFAVLQGNNDKAKVLATGGLHQAGNALSSSIAYNHLAVHLGKNATWGSKKFPIPTHYFEALKDWRQLQFLKKERLGELLADCTQPMEFGRFVKLVSKSLGWELYEAINIAKEELSTNPSTIIHFPLLGLDAPLTLVEFERYAWPIFREIHREALATIQRSNIAEQITAVILTGGTSKVPAIQKMARDMFPASTFVLADPFNSVTGGLAIVANRLNSRKSKSDS